MADLRGEPAMCQLVRLADGTTLRALCPLAGPVTTTAPPPGAVYLGSDAFDARIWATTDGHIIRTAAKPLAADVAADYASPLPPPPQSCFNRRTVCCASIAILTHFLVLGVAVGWAAGRPSTGMGFIVGLPTAAHEAGTLIRRAFNLFSLPSIAHTVMRLTSGTMSWFGYIGTLLIHCCCFPAILLHQVATCLPFQRWAACQQCLLMLAAATIRPIVCIT